MHFLEEKHKKNGRNTNENNRVMIIDSIDSIDGAEDIKSKKKITSVISYSMSMIDPDWLSLGGVGVKEGVTACSSLNILTWMQLRGKETTEAMLPSVKEYLYPKHEIRTSLKEDRSKKYDLHDMYDGKMIYCLLYHS